MCVFVCVCAHVRMRVCGVPSPPPHTQVLAHGMKDEHERFPQESVVGTHDTMCPAPGTLSPRLADHRPGQDVVYTHHERDLGTAGSLSHCTETHGSRGVASRRLGRSRALPTGKSLVSGLSFASALSPSPTR